MTRDEMIGIIKQNGYDCHPSPKTGNLIILEVDKGTDRKGVLWELRNALGFSEVRDRHTYSKQGALVVDRIIVVAKEVVEGGLLSSLDARTFMKGAKEKTLKYKGEDVTCFHFTSHKDIEKCMLAGIESEPMLGEPVKTAFSAFFDDGKFDWSEVKDVRIIKKLAAYAGEVLTGWVLLQPNYRNYVSGDIPMKTKASEFYLPNDPQFSGVDCFVICGKDIHAVSNKADRGAAASLFSNVMPTAQKRKTTLKGKTLKELCSVCDKVSSTSDNRKIIYEWGVNKLLGMSVQQPHTIVKRILDNTITANDAKVIEKVRDYMSKSQEHKRASAREKNNKDPKSNGSRLSLLPHSLTSFFCYELGDRLSADSLDDIINIVSAKDYYQFNLNSNLFAKGYLAYTSVKAGETDLKIVTDKSAWKDITAKQGYLNYVVSKK